MAVLRQTPWASCLLHQPGQLFRGHLGKTLVRMDKGITSFQVGKVGGYVWGLTTFKETRP